MKIHHIHLTPSQRGQLHALIALHDSSRRVLTRVRILLLSDTGLTDELVAAKVGCGIATVERTRKKFVQEGMACASRDKPRERQPRKIDLYLTARLTAIVNRRRPPAGHARWTLHLLARELVSLGVVDSISHESVRRALARIRRSTA